MALYGWPEIGQRIETILAGVDRNWHHGMYIGGEWLSHLPVNKWVDRNRELTTETVPGARWRQSGSKQGQAAAGKVELARGRASGLKPIFGGA